MELIEQRHSVRQYKDKMIEVEKRKELDSLCRFINKKAQMNIQILYDEPTCFDNILAHYGKFSGVKNYIALVGPKSKDLDEKAGYYGEMLVLKAQELGLNTCWVALTHGKSKAKVNRNEKQVLVIALGYGEHQGISHKSKKIDVDNNEPQWYLDGIKAAYLAPTAMNQQKFIIQKKNNEVSIVAKKGMYTKVDLGIVKYHFEVVSKHEVRNAI